jgi:WD40 repeat protein
VVEGFLMKHMARFVRALLFLLLVAGRSSGQSRFDVEGAARTQVVMVRVPDCSVCGAGIIMGQTSRNLYVVTALHVARPDQCQSTTIEVKSRETESSARLFDSDSNVDLAVLEVDLDAAVRVLASGLDYEILAPVGAARDSDPVYSMGCDGSFWRIGHQEVIDSIDATGIRYRSNAKQGQSGGALFNEAWELLGMIVDAPGGPARAVAMDRILSVVSVPALTKRLKVRPQARRARGNAELLRETSANLLAERAKDARTSGDVLGAISYLAEAGRHSVTLNVQAEALILPPPPLTHAFTLAPVAGDLYQAFALDDARDLAAIGTAGGTVRLIRQRDGSVVRTLRRASAPVTALAFSPDGSTLAAGLEAAGDSVKIALLDTAGQGITEVPLTGLMGGGVHGVRFATPDRIVGLTQLQYLVAVDVPNLKELRAQRARTQSLLTLSPVDANQFLGSGTYLNQRIRYANDAFTVTPWTTGNCPRRGPGSQLVYAPSTRILTASGDDILQACETQLISNGGTGSVLGTHAQGISAVASVHGQRLAISGSWDQTIRLWDTASGSERGRSGTNMGATMALAANTAGTRVIAIDTDFPRSTTGGAVRAWNIDPLAMNALPGGVVTRADAQLRFGPPWAGVLGGAWCWLGAATPKFVSADRTGVTIRDRRPAASGPPAAARADCGLVGIFEDHDVKVYRRDGSGWTLVLHETTTEHVRFGTVGAQADVVAWLESVDGASEETSQTRLRVWKAGGATETYEQWPGNMPFATAVSEDGSKVAAYVSRGDVVVWDTRTKKQLLRRTHPFGIPVVLSFNVSSAGQSLFVPTMGGFEIWDMAGGTEKVLLPGVGGVAQVRPTPNGNLFIAGGYPLADDVRMHLWVLDSARHLPLTTAILPRGAAGFWASPDSSRIGVELGGAFVLLGLDPQAMTASNAVKVTGQRMTPQGLVPAY